MRYITRNSDAELATRINEKRRFIQVVSGPRQVGKTTAIEQVLKNVSVPSQYVSCDEPDVHDRAWLEFTWKEARIKAAKSGGFLLAIDEIQKISNWPETVKRLWDEDTRKKLELKLLLAGSSALLLHKGLTESLAGRFEMIRFRHWTFSEMKEAFCWDWEKYVRHGGYPGAASLVSDEKRWRDYVTDSLIEATLSKDILQLERIDKPALLRQLFITGCSLSGQIISYQKLVGSLQDAGNTTTLAHYLHLLDQSGLLCGLEKYSPQALRTRASSPKLQVRDNAFLTLYHGRRSDDPRKNPDLWGRFVESAVGAHLVNYFSRAGTEIFYWRERDKEVDFVIRDGEDLYAIEVKSGKKRQAFPGIEEFCRKFPVRRVIIIGEGGMPMEEFLRVTPEALLS